MSAHALSTPCARCGFTLSAHADGRCPVGPPARAPRFRGLGEPDERPEHIKEAEAATGINPAFALEVYAAKLPVIRQVAAAHGYAIGVHGSMARDLDLIAAPWTEEATPPELLAKEIQVAVGGFVLKGRAGNDEHGSSLKPHGRRCWSIHLGGGPYIDLSVMPPLPKENA